MIKPIGSGWWNRKFQENFDERGRVIEQPQEISLEEKRGPGAYKDPTVVTAQEAEQAAVDVEKNLRLGVEKTEQQMRALVEKLSNAGMLGPREQQAVLGDIEAHVALAQDSGDDRRYAHLQMSLAPILHALQIIEVRKEPSSELLGELARRAYDQLYDKLREAARGIFDVELDEHMFQGPANQRNPVSIFVGPEQAARMEKAGLTQEDISVLRNAAGFLKKNQDIYRESSASSEAGKRFLGVFDKSECWSKVRETTIIADKFFANDLYSQIIELYKVHPPWKSGMYNYIPEVIIEKWKKKADEQYEAGFKRSYSRLRPTLQTVLDDIRDRLAKSGIEFSTHNAEFTEEEKKLDQLLGENRARLDYLQFINPANGVSEKTKFFDALRDNNEYHPQFTYEMSNEKEDTLRLAADTLNAVLEMHYSGPHRAIFEHETEVQQRTLEFIRVIGNDAWLPQRAEALFGGINGYVVRDAEAALRELSGGFFEEGGIDLSREEVKMRAIKALEDVGAKNWSFDFHIVENFPSVVLASKKQVLFQKRETYPERFVEILIAHEIYGHVAQDNNAFKHGVRMLQSGLGNYEPLMEGFALSEERKVNPLTEIRVRFYYAAVAHAAKHSLRDTFLYLRTWLPEDDAYMLASRVKRGMRDTSKPGTWLKDKVYLEGLRAMDTMSVEDRALVREGKFDESLLSNVRQLIRGYTI